MINKNKKSFASDNNAGIHPEILTAIVNANQGHVVGYGDDEYTARAIKKFQEHFGNDIEVFFAFNGTGANVLGLKAITDSFNAIICAATAHLNVDECGAPEKFLGCKLLTVPTLNGKLTVDLVQRHVHGFGDQHHVQPKVISITQSTELGTVYAQAEIKALADFAHHHTMLLHMDGARIANAAASLSLPLRAITKDVGVDVLSFGGTKNGLMLGEAVIFFNKSLAKNFPYIRKQGMQLASKMRFISAQFIALLTNDLWLHNAAHANKMAKKLADSLQQIPEIKITQEVMANGVFAIIPKELIAKLQEKYFFYVWNEERNEVRWMTSFDTTEEDIQNFVNFIVQILKSQ